MDRFLTILKRQSDAFWSTRIMVVEGLGIQCGKTSIFRIIEHAIRTLSVSGCQTQINGNLLERRSGSSALAGRQTTKLLSGRLRMHWILNE